MACCQLDLANEFFGLPIEPSGGGSLQRGEWFGLGAGLTHDIAGVSVVVSQPFPNNGRNVGRIKVGGRGFLSP